MDLGTNQKRITHNLHSFFGKFEHVRAVLDEMSALVPPAEKNHEVGHLVIIGESGMGKSKLVEHFRSLYPAIDHEEFREVPVLYVEVPSNCTPKVLAAKMLLSLESPYWNVGDLAEKTHQLVTLLRACRVRLVILDEINHMADRGAEKTHYAAADWLKSLTNSVRIPFVLTGIPTVRGLLEVNGQFRDRFLRIRVLQPLSLENEVQQKRTVTVLKAYRKLLTDIDCIDFTDFEVARKIVFATAGRLRPLRELLVAGVTAAFTDTAHARIGINELSWAFKSAIWSEAPDTRNPFHTKFDGYPLCRPGEPFAPARNGAR